jgi:voltage-gated sodium channel
VLVVIVANAILMGLETSASLVREYGPLFTVLNAMIQAVFVGELALRLLACWPRPGRFFRDGWNVFDFVIVALSLLPVAGSFATVGRLARLLRVTRLVSVSPDLRLIIGTMLRSIPSMGNVALLLSLLVYVYAIIGFYSFSALDPPHWRSLPRALLSVFQLLTLEGWVEMQQAVLPQRPWAWLYFGSFVIVGVFIVINLFIAVVLNNLETVKAEEAAQEAMEERQHHDADVAAKEGMAVTEGKEALLREVADLRARLADFEARLRRER